MKDPKISDFGLRMSDSEQIRHPQSEIVFLFLGSLDDFPVLVIAAVRTGPMRHTQLVAIGALGKRTCSQVIMRPPTVAAGFGMSSFWIWHIRSSALPAAASIPS